MTEPTPRRLTQAQREDLMDARTLLTTAIHNIEAAIRDSELGDALGSAVAMLDQALTTLKRLEQSRR
jgi:hypothetical protein